MNQHLRQQVKEQFGVDLPIAGGSGSSLDDPILILPTRDYVQVEWRCLTYLFLSRGLTFKLKDQGVTDYKGRKIERVKVETRIFNAEQHVQETVTETYCFDISDCWQLAFGSLFD